MTCSTKKLFHAEMMGDIMFLQQGLRQHDAKEFVQAVVKEINGHVDVTTGPSRKEAKSLMTSRSYPQYGRCDASMTSQRRRSNRTRHD